MTIEQLNALTNAGLISDNEVHWTDVAPCDQERALVWLEQRRLDSLTASLKTVDAILKSE